MIKTSPFGACWDAGILCKYDVPVPRYTSYPTANCFSETYGERDYRADAMQVKQSGEPLSLYVHVPFCQNICYYCACNKVVTRDRDAGRVYLDYLEREIALQAPFYRDRPVTQLHWGGGTPTFLRAAELTQLMHAIAANFELPGNGECEYSIEIDPRTVNRETIALLRGLGFNRVSLGIQDFDPAVQAAINRIQHTGQIRQLLDAIRAHDFQSISFDLIYGLPHQTIESLAATLDQVLDLAPDRIACYNYAHLPDRFPSQRAIARHTLPSAEQKIEMLHFIGQRLALGGYAFVGMDHFVRDDAFMGAGQDRLQRNFQGYSTRLADEMLGLGVSAISQLSGAYAQNMRDLDRYYRALDEGRIPVEKGIRLTPEDRLRRDVVMTIACRMELNYSSISQRHGVDFAVHFEAEVARLAELAEDGLIEAAAEGFRVTDRGRLMLRNICAVFDQHLAEDPARRRFSRAV